MTDATSTLNVVVAAKDMASAPLNNIRTGLSKLGAEAKSSILTGIGLGAGVSAFNMIGNAAHAAVGFIEDSVRAAAEEEASIAALTSALKANDTSWHGNSDAIEKVIESRLKLGYTDTEQRASLAALVAMTKDHTSALAIERVAMDVAAITGRDFSTVNIMLGKAFEGNTAGLKRLGIVVDKGTSGFALLDAVQKRYAGGAEAFSKTAAGASKALAAEWDNLQEEVGKQLLPVLTQLTRFASQELVPRIKEAIPTFMAVGKVILDLGQVALPLLVVWLGSKAVAAFGAFKAAALGTLGPLGLVVTAVMAGHGAMQSDIEKIMEHGIAQKEGAAAAKAFADAMASNGGDIQKSLDAMNHRFDATFSNIPVIVNRGLEDSRKALAGGLPLISNAAYNTLDIPIWQAAYDAKQKAQEQAGQIPKAMADAMIANDKALIDSSATLAKVINDSLTVAQQRSSAIGFLTSQVYADALASGKPAAIAKANELANAALVVLWGATASGAAAGSGVGSAWVNGLNAALAAGLTGTTYTYINKYTKLLRMAGSPDYTHAIEAGVGVAKGWLGGVNDTLATGGLNLPSLTGNLGGMAMGGSEGSRVMGSTSSSGAGSGFVPAGPIPIMLDGQKIGEYVDKRLYVAVQAVGGGYRPR